MIDKTKHIRWTMRDGNVMAGTITDTMYDSYVVKRVDGGLCYLPKHEATQATHEDVMKACAFFSNIGR